MAEPKMVQRYKQLNALVAEVQPRTIVEIGTHRGKRAAQLSLEAMKYRDKITYLGFDIFEGGDAKFQEEVLNGKGPPTKERAIWVMHKIEKKQPGRFVWELIEGDTRETLAGRELVADFVFVDGDHRLATIRSDYAAVRGSKCVVFDDYFLSGDNGELPDLAQYGPNCLIADLPNAAVLPVTDRAKQGWRSALAVVMER